MSLIDNQFTMTFKECEKIGHRAGLSFEYIRDHPEERIKFIEKLKQEVGSRLIDFLLENKSEKFAVRASLGDFDNQIKEMNELQLVATIYKLKSS